MPCPAIHHRLRDGDNHHFDLDRTSHGRRYNDVHLLWQHQKVMFIQRYTFRLFFPNRETIPEILFLYSQSIDDDADSLRSRSDLTNRANITNGVTSWGSAFEKLLEDPAGLHTFAEFLKKEFSAENIYFWTSCERYRQLEDAERSKEAIQIFSKHLGAGCSEPGKVKFRKLTERTV